MSAPGPIPAPGPGSLASRLAPRALDRFLRYVRVDTRSDPSSRRTPSTAGQLELGWLLADELRGMGVSDVVLDQRGYVYGHVPGTAAGSPRVGLVAHLDCCPEDAGSVEPQVVERYDGGTLHLPGSAREVIDPAHHPALRAHAGHSLVTGDGTAILGADDKAGIAEIMAALEHVTGSPAQRRAGCSVAFVPDEELGRGIRHFDLLRFDASVAYTVDGGPAGEIQNETFGGTELTLTFTGHAAHPGEAGERLVSSLVLAARALELVRATCPVPERSSGREGFVHADALSGTPQESTLHLLVRHFDGREMERLVERVEDVLARVRVEEPRARIELTQSRPLHNMRSRLDRRPEVISRAERAITRAGLRPVRGATRGLTDGAALTMAGLPTPNLFTGAHSIHSRQEWVCVDDLGYAAATLVHLLEEWAG